MPSAVLVDPPPATPSDDECVASVVLSAYLTPLLSKHARALPLYLEDLVKSYDAAIAALTTRNTNGNADNRTDLESLHQSQLAAYETAARAALAESAEAISYPPVEDGEDMESYTSRVVAHIKTHHVELYAGWRIKEDVVDEVFWSPIREGAQKSYLENAKDKEPDTVGTVRDFEAAALGALVSKSEEHNEANGQEGATSDDDEAGGNDEEDEDEVVLVAEEGADDEDINEDTSEEKTTEQQPVKTPVPIHGKKRRRLPGGPLGGDAAQPQPAATKKQKTAGKGGSAGGAAGGAGRGSTTATGPGGRGGKGGRGGRGRRNRKKGAGGTAGGGNVA